MSSGFTTNIEDVWVRFKTLTTKEMSKAVKGALIKGANLLKNTTVSNLESIIIHHGATKPKYNDYLRDAVIAHLNKTMYDEELSATVHILGTRATGSSTFISRFYENGTRDRYQTKVNGIQLKKPRYLGAIKPYRFFQSANKTIESQLDRIYMEEIEKTIDKLNK